MQPMEHLAQSAGISVISGIWQGLILAAAAWLCLRLVPRTPAATRFAVWTLVLAVVALLPLLEGFIYDHGQTAALASTASIVAIDSRWSLAIAALWLAASLFRASDLAIHALQLWSLRRRSQPIANPDAAVLLLSLKLRRPIELCTSTDVYRPGVIGFFRPRILIPTWLFDQITASELEQIVLHEIEHLRRGDDWVNLLQKLSLVLFPLNPILVWVERRLCFERELACDDGVLCRTKAPRAYATCLTSLAERGLDHHVPRVLALALGTLGAFGAAARHSELARRVHRILRRETVISPLHARAVTSLVALMLVAGAAGLAHCPQLISFAAAPQTVDARPASPNRASLQSRKTAFRSEPVVYHQASQPHATLLKASVPDRRNSSQIGTKAPVLHRHCRLPALSIDRVRQSNAGPTGNTWLILSSWTESDHPRLVLPLGDHQAVQPVSAVFTPHYAAVPTDSGWLIIQL